MAYLLQETLLSPDVGLEQNIYMETATTNSLARVPQGPNLKPPIHPAVWRLLLQGTNREMRLWLYHCTLGDNLIFCFHRRQQQPNMMGLLICAFHGVCQGGWERRVSGGKGMEHVPAAEAPVCIDGTEHFLLACRSLNAARG